MMNIEYGRMRWALLAFVIVTGGVFVLRRPRPEYAAAAVVAVGSPVSRENANPVRRGGARDPGAAADLMKRARVVDTVVKQLSLYVTGTSSADARLVENLTLKDQYFPGKYRLTLDAHSRRWLLIAANVTWADSGIVGDSVGRNFGLNWQPNAAAFMRLAGHDVAFDVVTPRKAASDLMARLTVAQTPGPNVLRLTLADPDPRRAARAVNAISRAYTTATNAAQGERATVRDTAIVPDVPTRNTTVQRAGVAVASGVAVGLLMTLMFATVGARGIES